MSIWRKQYNQKELGDPGPLFNSWPWTYALFITGIVLCWVVVGLLAYS
jgi:hypothetical protein